MSDHHAEYYRQLEVEISNIFFENFPNLTYVDPPQALRMISERIQGQQELTVALAKLREALEFYDRTLRSSEDERIAVGRDHHTRLMDAVRSVVQRIPEVAQ